MTDDALDNALRVLTRQCGYERISRSLRRLKRSERSRVGGMHDASSERNATRTAREKRPRLTASEYVAKMDLPRARMQVLIDAAERFQNKSFLPTVGDIRNFFGVYEIDGIVSSSRANAVPRVFRFIAAMSTDEARRMLDDGMFSGPAELGPIADAIREAGKERIRDGTVHGETMFARVAKKWDR